MIDFARLTLLLHQVDHFRALPQEEVRDFVLAGRVSHFAPAQVIFQEDQPCAGLFVLIEGRVEICKISPDGQISILNVFEPVVMFNEVAALDRGPNPVTALAGTASLIWQIDPDGLESLLQQHPRISFGMLRVLAARNRLLVTRFQDLSFRSVLARAAKLLLELSRNGQVPIDRRQHPNYQMAARTATVPEAFSRSLRILKSSGAIHCTDRMILVQDIQALSEFAQVKI